MCRFSWQFIEVGFLETFLRAINPFKIGYGDDIFGTFETPLNTK